jgi:MFS transporter, ACS family, D-galactonate transporter
MNSTTFVQTTEPTVELKTSPQRWWLMALLVAGMIFCYAQRGALSVAAPSMMQELGLSQRVMGWLMSAFFWTYSFMQMPAGWLVDRFGVKRGYALGYLVWSVGSALTGFARSLPALIGARMLLGIGQAAAFPASARAVANWFQERERGTVTAGYLTGVRLGQALINAVGFLLLGALGFMLFFLAIGIVPLVWLLPWFAFLGRWEKGEGTRRASEVQKAAATGISFVEGLALFRQRSVIGIFLGFFAFDYAWFVFVNWLPSYLLLERKFSKEEAAFYGSVPFVVMSVVIVFSGLASDWLVRRGYSEIAVRKSLIVIGLLAALLIVPAGLVENRMTSVLLLTLSLCGLGICSPNTWTLTQAVCSKNIVGTVSGIQNFGGNVGGILAPIITGHIAQMTGSYAMAFVLTGAILIFGVFSYWLLISRRVEWRAEP